MMYWYAGIRFFVLRSWQEKSAQMVSCRAEIRFWCCEFVRTFPLSLYILFLDRNKGLYHVNCTKIIHTERFCCVCALKGKFCILLIHTKRRTIHFVFSIAERKCLSFADVPKKERVLYFDCVHKDRWVLFATFLCSVFVRKNRFPLSSVQMYFSKFVRKDH